MVIGNGSLLYQPVWLTWIPRLREGIFTIRCEMRLLIGCFLKCAVVLRELISQWRKHCVLSWRKNACIKNYYWIHCRSGTEVELHSSLAWFYGKAHCGFYRNGDNSQTGRRLDFLYSCWAGFTGALPLYYTPDGWWRDTLSGFSDYGHVFPAFGTLVTCTACNMVVVAQTVETNIWAVCTVG